MRLGLLLDVAVVSFCGFETGTEKAWILIICGREYPRLELSVRLSDHI